MRHLKTVLGGDGNCTTARGQYDRPTGRCWAAAVRYPSAGRPRSISEAERERTELNDVRLLTATTATKGADGILLAHLTSGAERKEHLLSSPEAVRGVGPVWDACACAVQPLVLPLSIYTISTYSTRTVARRTIISSFGAAENCVFTRSHLQNSFWRSQKQTKVTCWVYILYCVWVSLRLTHTTIIDMYNCPFTNT